MIGKVMGEECGRIRHIETPLQNEVRRIFPVHSLCDLIGDRASSMFTANTQCHNKHDIKVLFQINIYLSPMVYYACTPTDSHGHCVSIMQTVDLR